MMILNYLTIGTRYLLKNRTFSAINIFGLTLGFICFMLIGLFIHDELSYDTFHPDHERIYRVIQHDQKDNVARKVAPVAARIGPDAMSTLPEIEAVLRVTAAFGRITMGNDPAVRDYQVITVADSNFFKFFAFELIEGDPATALSTPDGVVLSETTAKKYFGDKPALGQTLWGSTQEFTVTGIMKDFPSNSHLGLEMIFAEVTWSRYFPWYKDFVTSDWTSNSFITYVKLREGSNIKAVAGKLTAMTKRNYPADREFTSTFELQPLDDIHLYSEEIQGQEINMSGIRPFYLYMFAAVAFMILLIACLNYMNLSTAAAFKRVREIGTRKTLGALKSQLLAQFSGEAILIAAMSLVLAIAVVQIVLPSVNEFLGKQLAFASLPVAWLTGLLIVLLLASVSSSAYPALVIAKVKPADAMKKDVRFGNRSIPMRKLLVVLQFSISIMMIAATMIIYRQIQFMREKSLGFDPENLLVIDINSRALRNNFENVKDLFSSVPEVKAITTSTRVPGEWKTFPIATVKASRVPEPSEMIYVGIDNDFLDTYKIKLLAGRNFVAGKSDSTKVLLTKLAVETLGLQDPVGHVLEIPSARFGGEIRTLERPFVVEVVGVVQDFHFESFRQKMMPLIFANTSTPFQLIDYYTMKVETTNWDETLAKLREVNHRLTPDDPLEHTFLESRFESFYQADKKRGQIFLAFSLVVVLIASLGLFALVSYSVESRTKEIGIRKVLGASVQTIVRMISAEFLLLVVIAGVISVPVTAYLMQQWLQDFAYPVSITVDIFVLALAVAVAIAFATIGTRAIRAALANPVKSLRNE